MSLTLTNCGYKNVGSSSKNKFQVEKINIKGNAKDAYILKNEILLYSSKNTVNLIELDITINIISETKEKNITNLVTKYQNIYNIITRCICRCICCRPFRIPRCFFREQRLLFVRRWVSI